MVNLHKAKKVKAAGGYWAYIPPRLPIPIRWTDDLVQKLSLADACLGQLSGASKRLPNPHLFVRPFSRKEAVLSSRIEGTQTSLSDLLLYERSHVSANEADTIEVLNYIKALEFGVKRLDKLPLSMRLLNELHEVLMQGVRGQHATPGEPRRTQNWIGKPGCTLNTATYVPPPINEMHKCLTNFEKYLHEDGVPALIQVSIAHHQFEAIHPYLDGNGRLGRLLIILFMLERNLIHQPILYLSAYFERNKEKYYSHLLSVSIDGAWLEWYLFFLQGIVEESQNALQKIEQIDNLLEGWQSLLSTTPKGLHHEIVFNLLENPFISAKQIAKEHRVAFTTAQRAIDKLAKTKILHPINDSKRGRMFIARKLVEILED